MEHLRCFLAVGKALVAPRQLDAPSLELLVPRLQALLRARDLAAPLLHLRLDLGPEPDGLFARLDPCLPPHRLCLALGILQELLAGAQRLVQLGGADRPDKDDARHPADHQADHYPSGDEHACTSGWVPARGIPNLVEPKPWRASRHESCYSSTSLMSVGRW